MTKADDDIVLTGDRRERGTVYLLSGSLGVGFGPFRFNGHTPAEAKPYHWGQRAATGALTLLPGPDPRDDIEDILW